MSLLRELNEGVAQALNDYYSMTKLKDLCDLQHHELKKVQNQYKVRAILALNHLDPLQLAQRGKTDRSCCPRGRGPWPKGQPGWGVLLISLLVRFMKDSS